MVFDGSIVFTKSVPKPVNWKTYDGSFREAPPIPLIEAVNTLNTNITNLPKISVVGKVFKRWPFYCDITGKSILLLY